MATITYSFTIEDLTAPTLQEILWLNPRRCRIKWNEALETGNVPGGSCFVQYMEGVEVVSTTEVLLRGATLSSSWVGYGCQLAGTTPQNCRWRPILAVDTSTGKVTLDTSGAYGALQPDTGIDINSSGVIVRRRTIKASIGSYKLTARLSEEGLSLLPNDPLRIQCAFLPLPKAASIPTAAELPTGADPTRYTYIDWHDDVSFGRLYRLTADKVEDIYNNATSNAVINFTSPTFGKPPNRIGFWSDGIIPPTDRLDDMENNGLLRKMAVVLDDVMNSLWYRIDQIQYINDPDRCPDGFVDHLLFNRGNPFRFPLPTMLLKRKLAHELPRLYRKVGTSGGIEEFIYRLLGITIDIQPLISRPSWVLGDATYGVLGVTTILASGSKYEKNCYKVLVSGLSSPLTAAEERIIRDVCEWADPIWMHLTEIDDGFDDAAPAVTPLPQWILGVSALGTETYLS